MKFMVLGKKHMVALLAVVLVGALVILAAVQGFGQTVATRATSRKLPIYSVSHTEKVASLSFDAAWGNEDTQQLIEILGKYQVKATFFVVGEWVDKYPESVKALSDAGHEVMNHSDQHPHMPTLSREQMMAEIKACDDKIAKITGKQPNLFRAPYGDYSDAMLDTLTEMGHYCIQWDVDLLHPV